jgi:ATP-dependent RNA helicase DeaD
MSSFEELGLSPEIMSAIKALGFNVPFPIQEAVIPLLWSGSDVIGQAHTGTGKTAAFGLPLLEIVDEGDLNVQALVLVPTRELAVQVAEDINSYGKLTRKRALAIYGGQSIHAQIDALEDCPQIIVGTPGRVIDHLERGTLRLDNVQCVVLDEADRMLDMGFIDDVERILGSIKRKRQTALFSATMPEEILKLAHRHMKNPREVLIESEDLNVKEISQYFYQVDSERKLEALLSILQDKKVERAMVFCRTKRTTFWLAESLRRRNENATAINGSLSQNQRDHTMEAFRNGRSRVLVATDLAGRGLDIDGVTHIINYDVPEDPYTYFHRIGRTGRAGKTGIAMTIVSPEQAADFRTIQEMANYQIERLPLNNLPRNTLTPRNGGQARFHRETRGRLGRPPRHFRHAHSSALRSLHNPRDAFMSNPPR